VVVDSAHANYHTLDNLYAPFAALLRNDGFRVVDSKTPFTADSLAPIKVLVISNPLPASRTYDESLNAPPISAFTRSEIDTVRSWVLEGGSLLLVVDHRPFTGGAGELALAFGFRFENGTASRVGSGRNSFTIADGTLKEDVITRGRSSDEAIDALTTFVGSAFEGPPDSRPIIVLPSGFSISDCGLPCPQNVAMHDAAGYLQGAVLTLGKGRVAVFGEAAMFTAQMVPGSPPFRFGFNAEGAEQNKQFILNLMRWLSGVLPE
jgi:hypothetical protein